MEDYNNERTAFLTDAYYDTAKQLDVKGGLRCEVKKVVFNLADNGMYRKECPTCKAFSVNDVWLRNVADRSRRTHYQKLREGLKSCESKLQKAQKMLHADLTKLAVKEKELMGDINAWSEAKEYLNNRELKWKRQLAASQFDVMTQDLGASYEESSNPANPASRALLGRDKEKAKKSREQTKKERKVKTEERNAKSKERTQKNEITTKFKKKWGQGSGGRFDAYRLDIEKGVDAEEALKAYREKTRKETKMMEDAVTRARQSVVFALNNLQNKKKEIGRWERKETVKATAFKHKNAKKLLYAQKAFEMIFQQISAMVV